MRQIAAAVGGRCYSGALSAGWEEVEVGQTRCQAPFSHD